MKLIILALLIGLLVACAPRQGEVTRPGIITNPETYLKRFPLDRVTKTELIEAIGPPHRTSIQGDKTYLTYEIEKDWEYVYVIEKDIIVDVRFYVGGPYGGASARKKQGLD